MYISKIVLNNFRGYLGEHTFCFRPGINYLTGSNNVGKSSLFYAITLLRSATIKDLQCNRNIYSSENDPVSIEITFSGDDLALEIDNLVTHKSKEALKNHIIWTYNIGHLTFKRTTESVTYDKKVSKPGELLVFSDKLNEFENITGLDAPIKALFEITWIEAQQSADSEIKKTTTSPYITLLKLTTKEFFKSPEYRDYLNKTEELLKGLEENVRSELLGSLSDIITNQFGRKIETSIQFSEPTEMNYLTNSKLFIDDGINKEINDHGQGLQRSVALAIIQKLAAMNNKLETPIFYLIDEPEVYLHPTAQHAIRDSLVTLSDSHQVFVSTHSPFIMDRYSKNGNRNSLKVLKKIEKNNNEFIDIDDVSDKINIISNIPTTAEINYFAYGIVSIDFHNQLFDKCEKISGTSSVKGIDDEFYNFIKDDAKLLVCTSFGNTQYKTLPTKIRNLIHHNAQVLNNEISNDDMEKSVKFLISYIEKNE